MTMDGVTHDIGKWDLLIAHPPCTYLSNAGARHLWKDHQLQEERVIKGIQGRDLFMGRYPKDLRRESGAKQSVLPAAIYPDRATV